MKALPRCATVVALTAMVVAGLGSSALAKESPDTVRIEGLGLVMPMDLMGGPTPPTWGIPTEFGTLMDALEPLGLGMTGRCRLATRPPGDLGPRYRLTWRLPSFSAYHGWGELLNGPVRQDFYPEAPGGPVSYLASPGVWLRARDDVSYWWLKISSDLVSGGRTGEPDTVDVEGPGVSGTAKIADRSARHLDLRHLDPLMLFVDESGLAGFAWDGGVSCRDGGRPAADLGPGYTVTWSVGRDEFGVQVVHPYATGGPVVLDTVAGGDPVSGWFRADPGLLTVLAQLGLPTEAAARAAVSPARVAVAPVAATRPAAAPVGSAGGKETWLWLLVPVAALVAAPLRIYARRRAIQAVAAASSTSSNASPADGQSSPR